MDASAAVAGVGAIAGAMVVVAAAVSAVVVVISATVLSEEAIAVAPPILGRWGAKVLGFEREIVERQEEQEAVHKNGRKRKKA